MDKIKVFLSSRVKSVSKSDQLDRTFSLKELRKHLKEKIEASELFEERIWDIIINETDFDSPIGQDAFDNCMKKMREANVIIILFNGETGWGIDKKSNGMCHEEFLIAANEYSKMAFALDLRDYFNQDNSGSLAEKNRNFVLDVQDSFGHMVTPDTSINTVNQLFEFILSQVKRYLLESIDASFKTQKRIVSASSIFGATLDWSKLNYPEREEGLKTELVKTFTSLPEFEPVLKAYHGIPDHMSIADARNRIGRPFVYEHKSIIDKKETSGIVHFIAVYGNVTEIQAKNLVGYPDITVIKGPFGFYLWEKNVHIQIFFLRNCINPQTVRTRLSEVINWLNSSREKTKILKRAEARYSILKAINSSGKIIEQP